MNFLFQLGDLIAAAVGSQNPRISNLTFLHWIGSTIRNQLLLIPMSVARWLFIGLYLALLAWVVQLPAAQTTPPNRRCQWYEDLRIWAWLAILIQIVIYALF